MILQRKMIRDTNDVRIIRQTDPQTSQEETRLWKARWAEYVREKFENTTYLQKIVIIQVKAAACPIDAEVFASFVDILHSFIIPSRTNDEDIIGNSIKSNLKSTQCCRGRHSCGDDQA